MKRKLLEDEERLVLENMRLVKHTVRKMGIDNSNYNYEDIIQSGYLGLIKAARTFDSNIAKFASYACICIRNEILMFLRKECKIPNLISLEDEYMTDKYSDSRLTYGDVIKDKDVEFSEDFINQESIKKALSLILNCFTTKEKIIMLYGISGLSQQDISKKVNLTQSAISRAQKRMQISLKQLIDTDAIYERKYEVELFNGEFIIKCKFFNIKHLNFRLENLEYEMKSENNHFVCSFERVKNELIMKFPIDIDSCYIIAKVIQIVENND